jgi:hypothetical protein
MAFWSEDAQGNKDPKRNFRFQVTFNGLAGASGKVWFAKKIGKPNFTVTESSHDFFNHKFYFPGRVEWQTVTLTLVDPVDSTIDTAAQMAALMEAAGYEIPAAGNQPLKSMSKGKAVASLGAIKIEQLDAEGVAIETWTLENPFIKTFKLGDLDYSSDDLTEMELEIRYDYATFKSGGAGSKANSTGVVAKKDFFNPKSAD